MFLSSILRCSFLFLFFCKGNSVQVDICSNNILTFENETVHVVTPNYPNYDLNADYDCSCNFSSNKNIQFIKKEGTLSLLPDVNAISVYYEYEGGIKGYFLHKLIDSPFKKDLMVHYVRTKTVSWFRQTYGKFNLLLNTSSPVNMSCFSHNFPGEILSTTFPTKISTKSNNQLSTYNMETSTQKTVTYGESTTENNPTSTFHSTHLTTNTLSNSTFSTKNTSFETSTDSHSSNSSSSSKTSTTTSSKISTKPSTFQTTISTVTTLTVTTTNIKTPNISNISNHSTFTTTKTTFTTSSTFINTTPINSNVTSNKYSTTSEYSSKKFPSITINNLKIPTTTKTKLNPTIVSTKIVSVTSTDEDRFTSNDIKPFKSTTKSTTNSIVTTAQSQTQSSITEKSHGSSNSLSSSRSPSSTYNDTQNPNLTTAATITPSQESIHSYHDRKAISYSIGFVFLFLALVAIGVLFYKGYLSKKLICNKSQPSSRLSFELKSDIPNGNPT